jgi:hypothetical protein
MQDMLQALASAPSQPTAEGPGSPSPGPAPAVEGPTPESDTSSATLGELALAFKEATDPMDSAAILLEFLETAGFSRSE